MIISHRKHGKHRKFSAYGWFSAGLKYFLDYRNNQPYRLRRYL
jgi:hypothetical protein